MIKLGHILKEIRIINPNRITSKMVLTAIDDIPKNLGNLPDSTRKEIWDKLNDTIVKYRRLKTVGRTELMKDWIPKLDQSQLNDLYKELKSLI